MDKGSRFHFQAKAATSAMCLDSERVSSKFLLNAILMETAYEYHSRGSEFSLPWILREQNFEAEKSSNSITRRVATDNETKFGLERLPFHLLTKLIQEGDGVSIWISSRERSGRKTVRATDGRHHAGSRACSAHAKSETPEDFTSEVDAAVASRMKGIRPGCKKCMKLLAQRSQKESSHFAGTAQDCQSLSLDWQWTGSYGLGKDDLRHGRVT